MTMLPVDRVLTDRNLLGAGLGSIESWQTWLCVLRAAFGLETDKATFAAVAGDRPRPLQRVRELWAIVGRGGGKSRMAAALAVFLALFQKHKLARGEVGYVLVLAMSRDQAGVVFNYVRGFLQASKILAQEVASETAGEIRLKNGVVIAVHAQSFRSVRGRTLLACIFDEVSYWRDETSASPDIETYRAVLPSLARTGGMLIGISTPYRRVGLLHQKHRDCFGVDGDVLVVRGDSRTFNPTLDAAVIEAAIKDDPEGAISEWEAVFRSDLSSFLDDAVIDAAVDHGRPAELPPRAGVSYRAFCDMSGGRHDASVLCIGHVESEGRFICDALRGRPAPHDPAAVTGEFAALLKSYGLNTVTGDTYSGEWVAQAFRAHGITYSRAELPTSPIYLECLPMFNRGLIRTPDVPRLMRELRLLERRTHRSGKDSADHGVNGSDDYANALCGAAWLAQRPLEPDFVGLWYHFDEWRKRHSGGGDSWAVNPQSPPYNGPPLSEPHPDTVRRWEQAAAAREAAAAAERQYRNRFAVDPGPMTGRRS
jgi:hypothetical protein